METLCATSLIVFVVFATARPFLPVCQHNKSMSENLVEDPFYSIDAVMYESKKKKNPNIPVDPKDLEDDVKGKKVGLNEVDNRQMKITFDGVKLVYNKHV